MGRIRASRIFPLQQKGQGCSMKNVWKRGYEFPEVTSWIRANKKDFQLVRDMGMRETGILVSCSDYHIFYKMKMTRKQAMEHYLQYCAGMFGDRCFCPSCHLEDITRADIYGLCDPVLSGAYEAAPALWYPGKGKMLRYYGLRSQLPRCCDSPFCTWYYLWYYAFMQVCLPS